MSNVAPSPAADEAAADPFANMSEDEALGAMFDDATTDDEAAPARGADGRFAGAAKDGDPAAEGGDQNGDEGGEQPAGEGGEGGDPQPDAAASTVPLPPNWTGMDDDWKKIPADVQTKIAARDTELHSRMSEQGRQLGAFRSFADVIERNQDAFVGKNDEHGNPVTAPYAVEFLLNAQREMDRDPIRSLLSIAEAYGVSKHLMGVLTGQLQLPPAQQQQRPAGMSPAEVKALLQEDRAVQSANDEVSRLSKDKPLYAEIDEADMVHSIHKARTRLGDAASNEAVFNLAYDMAVHADPALRAKAAAAGRPAAQPDPKRTQDARRAASINVTSTSSGKGRQLTEEEQLGQAYDAAQKDR